jgi:hypothetical protein
VGVVCELSRVGPLMAVCVESVVWWCLVSCVVVFCVLCLVWWCLVSCVVVSCVVVSCVLCGGVLCVILCTYRLVSWVEHVLCE